MQVSVPLHGFESPQPAVTPFVTGVLLQNPPEHVSAVQGLPSLQSAGPLGQGFGPHAPVAGLQTSPGPHCTGVPGLQPVAGSHVGLVKQRFGTVHVTGLWTHPCAGEHWSVVHALSSSQSTLGTIGVPTQMPVRH
jgi:hypothetical protein